MAGGVRRGWSGVALAAALWAAGANAGGPPVVVAVTEGKGAAAAGLLPGDRLLRWRTAGAAVPRPVRDIWDWHRLESCDGMLGVTALEVGRGRGTATVRIEPGGWGLSARPDLPRAQVPGCEAALLRAAPAPGLAASDLERLAAGAAPAYLGVWYLFQAAHLHLEAKDPAAALRCVQEAQSRTGAGAPPAVRAMLAYRLARCCDAAGKPAEGLAALGAMAAAAREMPDGGTLEALALDLKAATLLQSGDLVAAEAVSEEAVARWSALAPQSLLAAQSLNTRATIAYRRSRYAEAKGLFEQVLALRSQLLPEGLEVAAVLNSLGMVAYAVGDRAEEERLLREALALRERAAPGSLAVASSYISLSTMYWRRGDLDSAEDYARRSLALREKLSPDGLPVADCYLNLGVIARNRGDLAGAEALYRRALAIRQRLTPGGAASSDLLSNLGEVARERGDYAGAERLHREALALRQRYAPGSMNEARSLHNMGFLALHQGDLETARRYLDQSLALKLKVAPNSPEVAWTRHNLALVDLLSGDTAGAIASLEAVAAYYETAEPEGLTLAAALTDLGHAQLKAGDIPGARAAFTRAAALKEAKAPGSLLVSSGLRALADVAVADGDLEAAAELLERALAIKRRLAPGSEGEADALGALAGVRRDQGRDADAARLYLQALDAVERQGARLGGSKATLAAFRAGKGDLYQGAMETLVALGRNEEAFATLERSRAKVLLDMLAERDLVLGTEAPAELDQQRKRLEVRREALYGEMEGLSPEEEAEELAALQAELAAVQAELDRVREALTQASPRLAALRYPRPLDAAAARSALPPGTLLLAYACGDRETLLFVMEADRPGTRVHRLPVGEADLARQVRRFRSFLDSRLPLETTARGLGRLLLGPAAKELARCDRLVVLPDGPLHLLPFGALGDPAARRDAYLGARKPLSTVLSVTLASEIASGRETPPDRVLVLGDPDTGPEDALPPLPFAREEAVAVATRFPRRVEERVGAGATEAALVSGAAGAGLLHLACHGLLDGRHPLESSLALAPGAGDDGRLHAWEVFERLRTPARLVALSACETGMGAGSGGEGLVGLTRAFQYAGARTVMATLWSVPDRSAADLSSSFYAALAAGAAPDEALRRAQAEALARGGPGAHPYYWSFFQLSGDAR